MLKAAAPLSALLLQRCTASRPAGSLPAAFSPIRSDHPLAALAFRTSGVMTRYTEIEQAEQPVLFAEGKERWHLKGTFPYSYLAGGQAPPEGIRSAPPLGGLGTGTVVLHTDGRLADWQIFNNSPGDGTPNVQAPEAFFGIRTRPGIAEPQAWTLRTHPPEGLPAMEQIAGSAYFPVTRLSASDPALPLALSLYGYGLFDLHDPEQAAAPAIVFSFVLFNPSAEAVETSLMFNLPNTIEGTFRTERGLILARSGSEALSGEINVAFDAGAPSYSMVARTLEDLWDVFEARGSFEQQPALGLFDHGALSTRFFIEPGASRVVSLVLAWRFPHRYVAGERAGNAYAVRYRTVSDVAAGAFRRLPATWNTMRAWQSLSYGSTLPPPVQDGLANSLAQLYKTTFQTEGGGWRHWDSFANPQISSLDQHLYRALPLLLMYPEVLQDQLRAYAALQHREGFFPEALGMGERYRLDSQEPPASLLLTPAFALLAYASYCYTGDRPFLHDMWPHIQKTVDWKRSIATPDGLPSNLPRLGDWQSFGAAGTDLFDALLYLSGLAAAAASARALDHTDDADRLDEVLDRGREAFEDAFWQDSHYRRHTSSQPAGQHLSRVPDAHPDHLVGFAWPLLLGLEAPFSLDRLERHLEYVFDRNDPAVALDARRREPASTSRLQETLYPATTMVWAALYVFTRGESRPAGRVLTDLLEHQRTSLHDAWGFFEQLTRPEGDPWSNPNHASHLAIWFWVVALTGQRYDAASRRLRFTPRVARRATLPFFTPGAHGLITFGRSPVLEVVSGRLALDELQVGDGPAYRDVLLEAGQSLTMKS